MAHRVPFQCSASALPDDVDPTAVQAAGEEQAMAVRNPARPLPEAWMRHLCLVQRSIRVLGPSPAAPTAKQPVAAGHDTPVSPASARRRGGIAWRVQERPSHRSASGLLAPELVWEVPTAVQASADEQDTPFSSEVAAAFGVGWMDQPGLVPALDAPLPANTMQATIMPAPAARRVMTIG